MAGTLLHKEATVLCLHSGQAKPTMTGLKVKVSGKAIVLKSNTYSVSGCSLPPNAGGPCVTAQWTTAAMRIKSEGVPVLLKSSQAVCTPTGTGLNITVTQVKVKGK